MKTCRQVVYAGRVQGVGFRYSVKQISTGFEITGSVRNLPDGTVEMHAVGEPGEVDAFIVAVAGSHLAGYIKQALVQDAVLETSAETGFAILY